MDNQTLVTKLKKVGQEFRLPGLFFSYEELQMGNINRTYKVNYVIDDGTGMARVKPFLMQRVNTYAFKNPIELMNNIDKVTEFIRRKRPEALNLHFHHTEKDGVRLTYLFDGDEFWRVTNYVPSVTFMTCQDQRVIRNAGVAFGDFQTVLADFDPTQLYYTIPDFHNTRKRYEALKESVRADEAGRADSVREEIDYLLSAEEKACTLTDLLNAGKLPLRVTHNDTKINNVLFDEKTLESLVVIDLDTVMPGIVGSDFGDAIRFAANFVAEDSPEFDKVGVDLNIFWAFADGFLSKTARSLTSIEVDTLGTSCYAITCELAARFLTDYLNGDKYFKTTYPEHNIVRARNQIALAKDMENKLDAMDAIVLGCVKKYANK